MKKSRKHKRRVGASVAQIKAAQRRFSKSFLLAMQKQPPLFEEGFVG